MRSFTFVALFMMLAIASCHPVKDAHAEVITPDWGHLPLACLPSRAEPWENESDQKSCYCPPKSYCPQTPEEYNNLENQRMPAWMIERCCEQVCPEEEIQVITYLEIFKEDLYGSAVNDYLDRGEKIKGYLDLKNEELMQNPEIEKICSDTSIDGIIECRSKVTAVGRIVCLTPCEADVNAGGGTEKQKKEEIERRLKQDPKEKGKKRTQDDIIKELEKLQQECEEEKAKEREAANKGHDATGCVLEGTPVAMADGTQKPIEQVAPGDSVMTPYGASTVTARNASAQETDVMYAINGDGAFFTSEHPIMTTEGWKAVDPSATVTRSDVEIAGKLEVGDVLVDWQGNHVTVESIEKKVIRGGKSAHNLRTKGRNEFIANGYIMKGFDRVEIQY